MIVAESQAHVRSHLRRILGQVKELDVIAFVPTSELAERRTVQDRADIVLASLDLALEQDGILLKRVSRHQPRPPVVVYGRADEVNSKKCTAALLAGADDVFPLSSKSSDSPVEEASVQKLVKYCLALTGRLSESETVPLEGPQSMNVRSPEQPVPRARATATQAPRNATLPKPVPASVTPLPLRRSPGRIDIVAIGSSTGGPQALDHVFRRLPANMPVPVVVTQHVPAGFASLLAEQLNSRSALDVKEARHGELLRPGSAWIAPHDRHIGFEQRSDGVVIRLRASPPVHSCRPAVDPMLMEAAEVWGPRVLAVVLTGMGYDGRDGSGVVAHVGGHVIAQDEASSVVWGMPGAVTQSGFATEVLPLDAIADAIIQPLCFGRTFAPQLSKTG